MVLGRAHVAAPDKRSETPLNWINSVVRPKIRGMWRKRDMPENLWVKCPESGQMVYYKDLEANQFVMPSQFKVNGDDWGLGNINL